MATYAIGDVQGCAEPLFELLEQISFNPEKDTLWLAGDLVNRGPDNIKVLRYIKSLGERAICVLGNHDLHLLAAAYGVRNPNRKDTFYDVLDAPDCNEILHWLRHLPLLHKNNDFAMTHAGIPHMWSLKKAQKRAHEVEEALRGEDFELFLEQMYGNEPNRWEPELHGWSRLRLITNYFTRMRFINAEGCLDFDAKEDLESAPWGYDAWFKLRDPTLNEGRKLLFGHWAAIAGETDSEDFQALDTGCVWGGALTALCLENLTRVSVECPLTL